MEYRLLGPVEVEREGRVLPLGGPKQRAVLAILLLRRGTSVPSDVLIDEVWGENAPATARNALQGYVFQLRKLLEPDVERGAQHRILTSDGSGYRLVVDPGELDIERFECLAAEGRDLARSRSAAAAERFDEALALWQGPPLADFAYEAFAQPQIARLEEERLAVLEEKLALELELGRHARVTGELEELCSAQPLRERPHALLMLALYRSGRHSEALESYRELRMRLDEELGLEPSAELQQLERQVLQQDATLIVVPTAHRRLPEGTVTFLCTDIEGSTQLLHELGAEVYGATLTEHRRLLRAAFGGHLGVEVDTQGDALFVAFERAQDALAAAAEVQEALREGPIRVRIGIHTGEPTVTEEGYVGMDVHRAARITSVCHGGQVVVSETTSSLVDGDVGLHDLGMHRLKDMTASQRLYQLGDGDFPPLRSLNQTNLPVQPTPLVGREHELTEIAELLSRADVRLITLTGPGGTGKTRLGLQAAADAVERMTDGVFWVSLAPIPTHELVPAAVARALDVREVPGEPLEQTLRAFLASRRLLLLLDNFEHVHDARSFVAELLAGCPDLHLLVTTRAALALSSEHVYAVPPLREDEAVDLFVERARQSGAEVDADATVATICNRLDRLPLAIELAAARARLLEPHALLERLERRLPLLKGGAPDLPARQQTLYAAIAWSHDLLDEEERTLFRRLSVFAGSFTVESAEAVAEADLWTLESLVVKSLVRRWGNGRLGLLETIREFAADQLEGADEGDATKEAHARHYLELALALEPHLPAGALRAASIDRLAAELDNLRAALLHIELAGRGEDLLRLATAMWRFWMAHGYFGSGRRWLERAFRNASDVPDELRARTLEGLAVMCLLGGDLDEGERLARDGLELFRALGDERGTAESIMNLGVIEMSRGDNECSTRFCEEAAALAHAAGLTPLIALTAHNLAVTALTLGEYEKAEELTHQSVAIYEELGDAGRAADAAAQLGPMLVELGRFDEGLQVFVRSLNVASQLAYRDHAVFALVGVGGAVAHDHDPQRVARLVGAADAVLHAIGGQWANSAIDVRMRERAFTIARERLSPSAFDAAYAAGSQLTFEAAVAEALELAGAES